MRTQSILVAVFVLASTAIPRLHAQLASPGPSGVVMGHLHFTVKDMEASRRFWVALGGTPVQNGALQLIQFPGAFVMLRQGEPTGGTDGSVVPYVGFTVKSLRDSLDKWKAAGISADAGDIITGPDGVRVQLRGDPSIDTPIRMESIGLVTATPAEAQAWYLKNFGATPGKTRVEAKTANAPVVEQMEWATLPGVMLRFAKAGTAPAGTKGRALDHIGFEVQGLEAFCKKLEAEGNKLDRPYRALPNSTVAIAFLTDPWGTYIELTENLAPR